MTQNDNDMSEIERPSGCECELGGIWNDGGPCLACKRAGFDSANSDVK